MRRENYLQVRNYARQMRREMTWAERRVWEVIRQRRCGGYRFLRQRVVGRFILDFYCAEKRFALEIDGQIHLRPDIAQYDQNREMHLRSEDNLSFLRLTNAEVMRLSDQELSQRILEALQTIS
ncbi:endonuclease domain-containing protein [Armatimonas sp.]|uniref:endonuclease domain-containing protein n=1 Tax=Armatimonas sp. TaxID=1872638 RepID=UPI00286C28F8|nr:endonuclease domain-containing protein [Armatimonas sp.]